MQPMQPDDFQVWMDIVVWVSGVVGGIAGLAVLLRLLAAAWPSLFSVKLGRTMRLGYACDRCGYPVDPLEQDRCPECGCDSVSRQLRAC